MHATSVYWSHLASPLANSSLGRLFCSFCRILSKCDANWFKNVRTRHLLRKIENLTRTTIDTHVFAVQGLHPCYDRIPILCHRNIYLCAHASFASARRVHAHFSCRIGPHLWMDPGPLYVALVVEAFTREEGSREAMSRFESAYRRGWFRARVRRRMVLSS